MSSDPDAPIPLELVEDDFTEQEHRQLDLEIYEVFGKLDSTNFELCALAVLVRIKQELEDCAIDITREDCSK